MEPKATSSNALLNLAATQRFQRSPPCHRKFVRQKFVKAIDIVLAVQAHGAASVSFFGSPGSHAIII